MSNKQLLNRSSEKLFVVNNEERDAVIEEIDEVEDGVKSFVFFVVACDVFLLLIVTTGLLLTFPLLSPVGLIFIVHLVHHYQQKLKE
ncbi:MAG: hypothetical protein Fur006_36330 [Coleofasciculaceae cyanobacterium]